MKRIIALLALPAIALLFYGCKKTASCTPNPPSSESTQILAFASAQSINVTPHASGVYYEIIDPGTGDMPDANSQITVEYTSVLLDGTTHGTVVAHQNTSAAPKPLSQFIEGWRQVLPLIHEGGTMKMIVPSALAFGCESYNGLPGNAVLYYEMELLTVD